MNALGKRAMSHFLTDLAAQEAAGALAIPFRLEPFF
jgi:hypothetical protein